ncbi:hypothetical protein CSUI_003630 [Cystoisospora suis]|uniref:Uncharacterized protein n=1 Tax=Cystoisospora suis TaxID=483139 RepID=A0A2C6L4U5_9APIC|nr:hypothetical protein CSUI_003630 [Cystoisospora suis]
MPAVKERIIHSDSTCPACVDSQSRNRLHARLRRTIRNLNVVRSWNERRLASGPGGCPMKDQRCCDADLIFSRMLEEPPCFGRGQPLPSCKQEQVDPGEEGVVIELSVSPLASPHTQDAGEQRRQIIHGPQEADATVRQHCLLYGTSSSPGGEERNNGAGPKILETALSSERKDSGDLAEEKTNSTYSEGLSQDGRNACQNSSPAGSCFEEPAVISAGEPNRPGSLVRAPLGTERIEEVRERFSLEGRGRGEVKKNREGATESRGGEDVEDRVQIGSDGSDQGGDHPRKRRRQSQSSSPTVRSASPCCDSEDNLSDTTSAPVSSSSTRTARVARANFHGEVSVRREQDSRPSAVPCMIAPANACVNCVFYCSKRRKVTVGIFDTTKVVVTSHMPEPADQDEQVTAVPARTTADGGASALVTASGNEEQIRDNESEELSSSDGVSLIEREGPEPRRQKKQRNSFEGKMASLSPGTVIVEEKAEIHWMSFEEARKRYWKALTEFLLSRCAVTAAVEHKK